MRIHEKDRKTWHTAAIDGHSGFNKLLPLSRNEATHLQAINIKTISQLYEVNDLENLQNRPNNNIDRQIIGNPELKEKLQLLRQFLNRTHLLFRDKRQVEEAAAGLLLQGEDNLSRHYRKMNRATKDAPAYHTRRQDGVFYPTMDTFNNACNIIEMGNHPKLKKLPFKF